MTRKVSNWNISISTDTDLKFSLFSKALLSTLLWPNPVTSAGQYIWTVKISVLQTLPDWSEYVIFYTNISQAVIIIKAQVGLSEFYKIFNSGNTQDWIWLGRYDHNWHCVQCGQCPGMTQLFTFVTEIL